MQYDDLFAPSKLNVLLAQYGFAPRKAYGQHYLISRAAIDAIISAADILPTETIVEVGPGFGVLTLALAQKASRVVCFEIERQLEPYWQERCAEYKTIEIIWGDAIRQFDAWVSAQKNFQYSIVANIPYQITGELLRLFLESNPAPRRIVVLVQKEVAERMCAKPGDMSLLSFATQYYGAPRIVRSVPAGSFFPPPKVASAVVCIDMHVQKESSEQSSALFQIARAGFAHKRKQLAANLRDALHMDVHVVRSALLKLGLSEKARPEELSVEQWKQLRDITGSV